MKKRRAGSEQRAEMLNRYLAERALMPPSPPQPQPPAADAQPKPSTSRPADRKGKGKAKVQVKQESVEPELRFDERERERERERSEPLVPMQESAGADMGAGAKTIAVNLVDFGFVLSLVFGGCCRYVHINLFVGSVLM